MDQPTGGELSRNGLSRAVPGQPGRRDTFLPTISIQCHAANLMPLGHGDLACVWFGGTQEGMADISIYMSRLAAGADRWSPAVKLADDPGRSEQNPILFPAPDGRLWLLYTSQLSGNQDTAVVRYRTSSDNGLTWSAPATLIADAGTFVRQPLYVQANGDWLLPTFRCITPVGEAWTGSHDISVVKVSRDQGRSWTDHAVPDSLGCVHMNIVAATGGGLIALYRSRWADHIYRSTVDGRCQLEPPRADCAAEQQCLDPGNPAARWTPRPCLQRQQCRQRPGPPRLALRRSR